MDPDALFSGDSFRLDGVSGSILGVVFEAMAEGVVVQDRDGSILGCNTSAERILGLTADQMKGRSSMDPRWRAIHDDGSPFPGEAHPAMVSLQTGEPCSDVIMGVHRPDESMSWIMINSRPLIAAGEAAPHAVVTTFTDITQLRELGEEKERLSAELEKALTSALGGFLPICANCKSIRNDEGQWAELALHRLLRVSNMLGHAVHAAYRNGQSYCRPG